MRLEGYVEKGWGNELIWATNEKYCGKLLTFNSGAKCSMHFHSQKDETWYILSGSYTVFWIDTQTSKVLSKNLKVGESWHNPPLSPHQIECIEGGTIIEVSTPDSVEDNYRVFAGDSQNEIHY